MKNISETVINEIKDKSIKPKPKWEFLLKDYVIATLFILNLILGSIGFSIVIYLVQNNDILFDNGILGYSLNTVLLSIPTLWILFTIIFIIISQYNFKHTKDGYKQGTLKITIFNILISLVLGFIINIAGLSNLLNNYLNASLPYYSQTADTRIIVWSRPEEGYLSGTISEILSEDQIKIVDWYGKEWIVDISNSVIKNRVDLSVNEEIKILGSIDSSNTNFIATEIRPWQGYGKNSN